MLSESKRRGLVVGPINLDHVCDLQGEPVDLICAQPSPFSQSKIESMAGGAGFLAASAASRLGMKVDLLSAIGCGDGGDGVTPDYAGTLALRAIQEQGFGDLVRRTPGVDTGRAIIVRFADATRLMVCDCEAASHICEPEGTDIATIVARYDLIYLSGYLLVWQPSREFAKRLLDGASGRVAVVLDLVPHDIYRRLTAKEIRSFSKRVDVVGVADITAAGLLGTPTNDTEKPRAEFVDEVFTELGPRRRLVLTYGRSQSGVIFDGATLRTVALAGAREARGRGVGAEELLNEGLSVIATKSSS